PPAASGGGSVVRDAPHRAAENGGDTTFAGGSPPVQSGGGRSQTGGGDAAAGWQDSPTEVGRATDASTRAGEGAEAGTEPFTDRWGDETSQWPDPPRLPPANWTEPDR
ncbi:MAG: hypothetical protein J2P57_19785, partial [Acidimicrobiaceae bacterium]|nr:hypothetical protein [Acidimicrobiaceae bacterium]